jgi:hypothetical protein
MGFPHPPAPQIIYIIVNTGLNSFCGRENPRIQISCDAAKPFVRPIRQAAMPREPVFYYAQHENQRLYGCFAAPGGGFMHYWVVDHGERGFLFSEACRVGGPFVAPPLSNRVLDYRDALALWADWNCSLTRLGTSTSPVTPRREE